MRQKFYLFLREKIAKVKDGESSPLWLKIINRILFPIKFMIYKINSSDIFGYDFQREIYHIGKLDFSRKFFDAFDRMHGRCFQIIKTENGITTVEKIDAVNMIKADKIRNAHEIHGRNGSWDENEYMCGLFNGMEYALSVIEDREPKYRTVPEMMIREKKSDNVGGEIKIFKKDGVN